MTNRNDPDEQAPEDVTPEDVNPEDVEGGDPQPAKEDQPLHPQKRKDDMRDQIVELYRSKGRTQEDEDEGESDEAETKQDDSQPTDSEEEDPELELLVFGERQKVKRSQLVSEYGLEGLGDEAIIRVAQKEKAADQRLRDAKELADQRPPEQNPRYATGEDQSQDEGLGDQTQPPEFDEDEDAPDSRPPSSPDQDETEDLDDIVQRVQFGDADEAKEALLQFRKSILGKVQAPDPDEIMGMFETRLVQRAQEQEIAGALQKFGQENPDLVQESDLFEVALTSAAREMLDDMKGIGLTEEQLKPISQNRQAIATTHRLLRQQGHNLRNPDQILTRTASNIRKKFHLGDTPEQPDSQNSPPTQTSTTQPDEQVRERVTRKEALQPQPRQGGTRASTQASGKKPRSAKDTIERMRRDRGFRSLAP